MDSTVIAFQSKSNVVTIVKKKILIIYLKFRAPYVNIILIKYSLKFQVTCQNKVFKIIIVELLNLFQNMLYFKYYYLQIINSRSIFYMYYKILISKIDPHSLHKKTMTISNVN